MAAGLISAGGAYYSIRLYRSRERRDANPGWYGRFLQRKTRNNAIGAGLSAVVLVATGLLLLLVALFRTLLGGG